MTHVGVGPYAMSHILNCPPSPELPTRVLISRVFLRGLALLDAPVPFPAFALYLLPFGSPVSDKGCHQSINHIFIYL